MNKEKHEFEDVIKDALESGGDAIKNMSDDFVTVGWGDIVLIGSNDGFTDWAVENNYASQDPFTGDIIIKINQGTNYHKSDTYASAVCNKLKSYNINCKNDVTLD